MLKPSGFVLLCAPATIRFLDPMNCVRDYLLSLEPDELRALATACGTTFNNLKKLAYNFERGYRPNALLAMQLELHSNQKVKRWDLIPERWHLTWDELKLASGAPPVPELRAIDLVAANDPAVREAA